MTDSASSTSLRFVRAVPADGPRVSATVEEAARWLASKGIPQWSWYLTETGKASIPDRITKLETYLVTLDDTDVATFTLQWADRMFWGDRGEDEQAGYIHGLAVRRSVAGRGIGTAVLRWAGGEIVRRGRPLFRLDCMAENKKLCDFYRGQGFAEAGSAVLPDRTYHYQLFERRAAT
jgi:GNAT superfamily N-acetyltransferase